MNHSGKDLFTVTGVESVDREHFFDVPIEQTIEYLNKKKAEAESRGEIAELSTDYDHIEIIFWKKREQV